jgi:hypothetical protein
MGCSRFTGPGRLPGPVSFSPPLVLRAAWLYLTVRRLGCGTQPDSMQWRDAGGEQGWPCPACPQSLPTEDHHALGTRRPGWPVGAIPVQMAFRDQHTVGSWSPLAAEGLRGLGGQCERGRDRISIPSSPIASGSRARAAPGPHRTDRVWNCAVSAKPAPGYAGAGHSARPEPRHGSERSP